MAAELLPRESPATSSDWIGYHIRGMMYLKSGDVENAIAVFTWGVQQNPFHRERQLFEAGLAAAKIRKGEFSGSSPSNRATYWTNFANIADAFIRRDWKL